MKTPKNIIPVKPYSRRTLLQIQQQQLVRVNQVRTTHVLLDEALQDRADIDSVDEGTNWFLTVCANALHNTVRNRGTMAGPAFERIIDKLEDESRVLAGRVVPALEASASVEVA